MIARRACPQCLVAVIAAFSLSAQSTPRPHGDSVAVNLVDVDIRAAVQSLAQYLDRPVVFGSVSAVKVTLQAPGLVPRAQILPLLRGMLASQSYELIVDSAFYRVQQRPAQSDAPPPRPPQGEEPVQLFVIHLRHARAADVAVTVNALYGRATAIGEIGAMPPTLDQGLRADRIQPGNITTPNALAPLTNRAAVITGELVIVPDPRSNSLLVRATADDFQLIDAAVKELDIRPLQVLIQVMIVEMRTDKSLNFGVDAKGGPFTNNNGTTGTGTLSSGGTAGDFVVSIMHLGGVNIDAVLTAAASRGDVKILSRPVVVAENNTQAQILVGSQRPFVQVSRSLPTDAATRDQVVQYKDVGTRLVVRPTISPDGYVVLEVTQEVNSATSEVQFNAPVISSRSVQTQVLIKDGHSVALGGLSDRERDQNQGGIPVLSSIPGIGGLFGHAGYSTTQTELYLFLTPHVIRTDADADSIAAPMLDSAKKVDP